eukprot:3665613-Rhodomonas_salina.1
MTMFIASDAKPVTLNAAPFPCAPPCAPSLPPLCCCCCPAPCCQREEAGSEEEREARERER